MLKVLVVYIPQLRKKFLYRPGQAPEGSRRLRLPDSKTVDT
jgi:hypothetical protein